MGLERVGHWWDGSMATLWRRDIWLLTDGVCWAVELRQGDSSKRLWRGVFAPELSEDGQVTEDALRAAEKAARDYVAEVMTRNPGVDWRDIFMPPRRSVPGGEASALRGR